MADDSDDDHKPEGGDDGLLASPSPSPTKLDVSNFQCPHPDCGRSYASKHGLDNHNRVHFTDNEKPFACPHPGCLSRYTNKRGVTRHFNLKHKDNSDWFNCPTAECDSSFFDERQLKLHQREHGLYRCTARHCAYEYTTEQELYDHREVIVHHNFSQTQTHLITNMTRSVTIQRLIYMKIVLANDH